MKNLTVWLQTHDVTIDLITVWALVIGFTLFGITKAVSWWTLRKQADATMVGVTLKREKIMESLLGLVMSTLYGLTLYAYYGNVTAFGFWDRLVLRMGLVVVVILASVYCVQFVYYLRRESKRGGQGSIPLADGEEGT